jgi:hypothetical protein
LADFFPRRRICCFKGATYYSRDIACSRSICCVLCFHSFIHQWLYSPLLGRGLFFSSVISFTQTVGLIGRVISPSQGRYLQTGQQKHRINAHTDIHALTRIRTHDPGVRLGEASSCLRPRGNCDRRMFVPINCNPRTSPNISFINCLYLYFFVPRWALAGFFIFLILYTVGRTPWTSDQPVARPLPKHRTTQTQNKRINRHPCL